MSPDSGTTGLPEAGGRVPSFEAVHSYVREVVAEAAGVGAADLHGPDALRDLRLDSLTRMNITVRFDQDLGDIPPTLTFEYPTVADIAEHLRRTRGPELCALLGQEHTESSDTECSDTESAAVGERAAGPVAVRDPAPAPVASVVAADSDIAVIAVTGRYPGAPDVETLWRNLRDGVRSITEVPADRWDWRTHFDPRRGRPDRSYGRWGGFIDGVAEFDAELFHVLPLDAVHTDPQERLFLQTCWHLFEQAGMLGPTTHEPSTGVFVGTMNHTYGKIGATGWPSGRLTGANSAPWSVANRVSYFFDLNGPSFAVDSACSSSLTAIHLACESLRRGECRTAVAGGVNLLLHPAHLVGLSGSGMLSSDEACKVFDEAADGFVPGEGVGAVLLKPLAAAVADGDHVWGVIKGSALNTAGRTSGYTVPDPARQSDLVGLAAARAGVEPHTLSYVEAHGTGTALGDPLEIAGLARALAPGRDAGEPCAVGSVKANIGHLEGAAGVAGLTKVLLQLKYGRIAPCVSLDRVNPRIDAPVIRFPRAEEEWRTPPGVPRRAGVSGFGAGGANAHLIVEEYLPGRAAGRDAAGRGAADRSADERSADGGRPGEEHVVLLSARTGGQLGALAAALARTLADPADGTGRSPDLAHLASSSQLGRRELGERLAVTARSAADLRAALEAFAAGRPAEGLRTGTARADGSRGGLLDDEDGRAYVEALTAKRRLDRLAALWTEGVPIDWSRLWPLPRPARVGLPPYPFERRRFWVDAAPAVGGGRDVPGDSTDAPAPAPVPAPAQAQAPVEGIGEAVDRDLRQESCGFLLVEPDAVDTDADLMDLGFDSISLLQLAGQVGGIYGIELDPFVVFAHPTLAALREHLLGEHADAVAARHRDPVVPPSAPSIRPADAPADSRVEN
ncbi:beta-ketoacyl synthase N-terminal-like domain-containing protein [Kitasatospora sp. NPDC058406]|uniref:beta-ketoacyl synthase N-terminal-like domain-containing protein n=1 Tax=Kitasatospora sp. NPDC058406 TaxID=3346483 RepID=UPI003662EE97